MWSFANGMESGAGLALFAIFVPIAVMALDAGTATRRVEFIGFLPAAFEQGHSIQVDSPVCWASYPWREFLEDGVSAELLGTVGKINVWRLSPQ